MPATSSHPRLVRAHPEIIGAFLVRQGEPRRKLELEARLLAGQGDGEIADRVGVDGAVIEAYAALFFDVRFAWRAPTGSSACVIGGRLYEGFNVQDIETVWKIVGFQCGPMVLDALIEDAREDGRPPADPVMAEQLKLLIMATAMPVTLENAPGIFRLNALAREIERAEAARSVSAVSGPIIIPSS